VRRLVPAPLSRYPLARAPGLTLLPSLPPHPSVTLTARAAVPAQVPPERLHHCGLPPRAPVRSDATTATVKASPRSEKYDRAFTAAPAIFPKAPGAAACYRRTRRRVARSRAPLALHDRSCTTVPTRPRGDP